MASFFDGQEMKHLPEFIPFEKQLARSIADSQPMTQRDLLQLIEEKAEDGLQFFDRTSILMEPQASWYTEEFGISCPVNIIEWAEKFLRPLKITQMRSTVLERSGFGRPYDHTSPGAGSQRIELRLVTDKRDHSTHYEARVTYSPAEELYIGPVTMDLKENGEHVKRWVAGVDDSGVKKFHLLTERVIRRLDLEDVAICQTTPLAAQQLVGLCYPGKFLGSFAAFNEFCQKASKEYLDEMAQHLCALESTREELRKRLRSQHAKQAPKEMLELREELMKHRAAFAEKVKLERDTVDLRDFVNLSYAMLRDVRNVCERFYPEVRFPKK